MELTGKMVAMLVPDGADPEVLSGFRQQLEDEGALVSTIGLGGRTVRLRDGRSLETRMDLESAQETWFDALVIAEGAGVRAFMQDERLLELITQFEIDAKPIAVVAEGVLLLVAAELVAGKRLAVPPAVAPEAEAEGGRVSDAPWIEDETWLSARDASSVPQVAAQLAAMMRRIHLAARDTQSPLWN